MSKLYFRYGAMGSSKTASALMARYNYEERGQNALMVKPAIDTRDGERTIKSRIGLEHECILFSELKGKIIELYDCIIVDECQFLSQEEVEYLVEIVDDLDIPILCYGLRTDFKGKLFTGSKALMELADTIEEIKTICWCGRKATMNARISTTGEVLKEGEQIEVGSNDRYTALCRKHWSRGELKR